ncbi:MAG: hypothetical protein ACE5HW_01120 [Candidatus Methanofastidiosia archaeon]
METRKVLVAGLIAGLVMGVALFIVGAITALAIYGPQLAPSGKFAPEQINAWYFLWTKLAIGAFFGVFFGLIYAWLPLSIRGEGALKGLYYGFWLWLIISLWNVSHPLVYGSIDIRDQIFWLIYTIGGFLTYGATLGYVHKRMDRKKGAQI